ncbi:ankyrin repeat-containing protein [Dorcoceras hygrometricum]|uniref:Ankyrin repeat-containing protein n=1 Tax=Dorcoceras hygrometricum TaxID=472368 RepID=A0A2Z7BSF8_9LAMI|nr:ankyrin repeat-containing protein [Dorcoceras hygrometricum]
MEALARQQSFCKKQMKKQYTRKRDDTELHSAARDGDLEMVLEIVSNSEGDELKELLSKQNQSGETALYVASECNHVDLVKELIKYHDVGSAAIKAKNGFDAFHIAAKIGGLEILKVLIDAIPQLLATVDQSNATPLHTAAAQGHVEVVKFLLDRNSSLATIARNNGKTALHSSARNGHLEVVKAILSKEKGIVTWVDKKGQTALHMAVKGTNANVVEELIASDDALLAIADGKGNSALHIATRKGRLQIVRTLLKSKAVNKDAFNKAGETAFDTAEKTGHLEIASILQECGFKSAKSLTTQPPKTAARELKQKVSDIKHEVHDQIEHTRQTGRKVRGIAKRLDKMQTEGLNNAITSTTVVAVLIATVAFAAIFTLPGQYADDQTEVPPGSSTGQANIAPRLEFLIFLISDSLALFISLAVVVVQTSVVVVEKEAKKQMMAVINKLMWLACAFVSVAFLALCYVIVGDEERLLAIGITVIGTVIMATTLGTLCYWVVMHRIEASNLRSRRLSARNSRSRSWSASDEEIQEDDFKKLYAL